MKRPVRDCRSLACNLLFGRRSSLLLEKTDGIQNPNGVRPRVVDIRSEGGIPTLMLDVFAPSLLESLSRTSRRFAHGRRVETL